MNHYLNLIKKSISKINPKLKNIDKISLNLYKHIEDVNTPEELDDAVYMVVHTILTSNLEGRESKKVIKFLNSTAINIWDHPIFSSYVKTEKEIEILQTEIEVEEGVLECPKCKSIRVLSYQLQTRSADEPMTIFARCTNKACKYRWKE